MQSNSKFKNMNRIDHIRQMLTENPEDVFLHYALAMEFMSVQDNAAAVEQLEWIRSTQSDYLPLYYQLAHLYEAAGATAKAIEVYESGMAVAEVQNDLKTRGELRSALEELTF